jgi:hypothetical protein
MAGPTFKGERLYVGDEYKVKYVSGNWVPGLKDYGTYIGEFRGTTDAMPENKRTVYEFANIRDEEFAKSMPQQYISIDRGSTRKTHNWAIESIERVEPDVVVYKPPRGGTRKGRRTGIRTGTRTGTRTRKGRRGRSNRLRKK